MKLKIVFPLLIFFLCGSLTIQAQNPYKEFGIEVEPLTLSKGKYIEFFTNDSLVRIGSVILDTRNNRIASFVVIDYTFSEATLEPEVSSRFLSPDPHATKYPNLSPYTYVANNPLMFIDPDGKDIVNPNKMVLNNQKLVSKLRILNRAIAARAGVESSAFTIRISGGDRYRDESGNIRSTTDNEIIANSSKTSKHLNENGARAADLVLGESADGKVTNEMILEIAGELGFTFTDDEGNHLHINLGERDSRDTSKDQKNVPSNDDLNGELSRGEQREVYRNQNRHNWKLLRENVQSIRDMLRGENE